MKKKLLFVIPSLKSGGAEKSLVTLLQTMDASSYDVDLFLFRREGLFLPLVPQWVRILDAGEAYAMFDGSLKRALPYFIRHGKCITALRRLQYVRAARDVRKAWQSLSAVLPDLSRTYDAAVAYLEGTATYFVADHVRAKKKITFLHTDYDRIREQKDMDTHYYAQFDSLVGVSEKCVEKLRQYFPFAAGKTSVIHNILSPALIRTMAQTEVELQKQGEEALLLTVGRLSPPKGIDLAVDACAILTQRGHNIRWMHIGIGELQTQIESQICAKGVQDRFILLGERSNPYPYIDRCDIYVQPSRFEGKSIAIDEAKCLAKPIVVTDFGTVHDQITDGVNGLIAPMTAQGIADAVERLLSSETLRGSLSAHLRTEKIGNEAEIRKLYALL